MVNLAENTMIWAGLGIFFAVVLANYFLNFGGRQKQKIGEQSLTTEPPFLTLSISEGQDDPTGSACIKLTIANHIGQIRKINKELSVPANITFPLEPMDTVTQVDVQTPDGHQHRLRYPRMNDTLVLHSYYSDWFGQPDSSWQSDWQESCR